jgi:ATP-binding cassette subfamily B protein
MDDDADDETLEALREQVENPMYRLFAEYGHGQRRWFALGVLTSTAARALALVPPVILGVAIDSVFHGDKPFSLPLIPPGWIPEATLGQFWFAAGVMGVAMILGAICNFVRQTALNLFSTGSSTRSGPRPTRRCSASTWAFSTRSRPAS